jgi:hypothetical protein
LTLPAYFSIRFGVFPAAAVIVGAFMIRGISGLPDFR